MMDSSHQINSNFSLLPKPGALHKEQGPILFAKLIISIYYKDMERAKVSLRKYFLYLAVLLITILVMGINNTPRAFAWQDCAECIYNCYATYWNSPDADKICGTNYGGQESCHTGNTSICTDLEFQDENTPERRERGRNKGEALSRERTRNECLSAFPDKKIPQIDTSSIACRMCLGSRSPTSCLARKNCTVCWVLNTYEDFNNFAPAPDPNKSTENLTSDQEQKVEPKKDDKLALNKFTDFAPIKGGFGFDQINGKNDVSNYIQDILTIGSAIFGGLAMLKIIFGGVMYATAAGNAQRIADAKSHILYALLGLALVLGANIMLGLFGAGTLY